MLFKEPNPQSTGAHQSVPAPTADKALTSAEQLFKYFNESVATVVSRIERERRHDIHAFDAAAEGYAATRAGIIGSETNAEVTPIRVSVLVAHLTAALETAGRSRMEQIARDTGSPLLTNFLGTYKEAADKDAAQKAIISLNGSVRPWSQVIKICVITEILKSGDYAKNLSLLHRAKLVPRASPISVPSTATSSDTPRKKGGARPTPAPGPDDLEPPAKKKPASPKQRKPGI